jgi:endonuclease-3
VGLAGLCKSAERKKVLEGRRRREVEVQTDGERYVKVEKVEEETVVKDEVVNEELPEGVKLEDVKDEAKEVKQEVKQEDDDNYSLGGTRSWRTRRTR